MGNDIVWWSTKRIIAPPKMQWSSYGRKCIENWMLGRKWVLDRDNRLYYWPNRRGFDTWVMALKSKQLKHSGEVIVMKNACGRRGKLSISRALCMCIYESRGVLRQRLRIIWGSGHLFLKGLKMWSIPEFVEWPIWGECYFWLSNFT